MKEPRQRKFLPRLSFSPARADFISKRFHPNTARISSDLSDSFLNFADELMLTHHVKVKLFVALIVKLLTLFVVKLFATAHSEVKFAPS